MTYAMLIAGILIGFGLGGLLVVVLHLRDEAKRSRVLGYDVVVDPLVPPGQVVLMHGRKIVGSIKNLES